MIDFLSQLLNSGRNARIRNQMDDVKGNHALSDHLRSINDEKIKRFSGDIQNLPRNENKSSQKQAEPKPLIPLGYQIVIYITILLISIFSSVYIAETYLQIMFLKTLIWFVSTSIAIVICLCIYFLITPSKKK